MAYGRLAETVFEPVPLLALPLSAWAQGPELTEARARPLVAAAVAQIFSRVRYRHGGNDRRLSNWRQLLQPEERARNLDSHKAGL